MKSLLIAVALIIIAITTCPTSEAAEPWADGRLEVHAGLVAWFDGSAQNAARGQQNAPELEDGDQLDVWYDASGHGHHLRSDDPVSRPTVRLTSPHALVRFDGQADFVAVDGLQKSYDELTIFVVAAPLSNDGGFRALLGMNAEGQQDYTSGLNIDQGPYASNTFATINVEGTGFNGAKDLRVSSSPFLRFERICVTSRTGPGGVVLFVDGQREGSRDREDSKISMDQVVVGARFYGNPLVVRGHFAGEIAEVILFDRVLTEAQRLDVDRYLASKYESIDAIPPLQRVAGAKPFHYLIDPPPVQILVPGFAVKEIPVELPNVNNVLYRDDGQLVALAYDGNIYLLSDSDGDGLEDRTSVYWENKGRIRSPIGMDLTPAGYDRGPGVFVTSKTECILVRDTNSDDMADEVITVAEGWQETFHGVDALGMEVNPDDGSIYFGIGTQNFADAYDVDEDGTAQFRIEGQRGTIQRVSPDFQSRETIATGLRFPVAIRFNKKGDLFCTDQEGATWLPNGNPLDELLHIDQNRVRHYGFPPRHPQHLPGVIDEPSLFDYRPQHQSTCGLNFNEPVNGGPVFGPDWWEGDAIVTGYSRGKLYRTTLANTSSGYVAQNQLFASLTSLTVDACVSPQGGLTIATHSGPPDWGSGPGGAGKLYKVTYADHDAPIPVMAWARTPQEVRVAMDREMDPRAIDSLTSKTSIEYGRFVAAGDRFEHLRPPYALVGKQVNSPRFDLAILAASLSPDRRTLILSTAPHRAAVKHAITLPGIGRRQPNIQAGELRQAAEIDLAYDLTGVEASWYPQSADLPWQGWIPHLDLDAARRFTVASAEHDELWRLLGQAGTLTLRTQLQLDEMLRPVVQPGSQIDFEYPVEETTVVLESNCSIDVALDGQAISVTRRGDKHYAELGKPYLKSGGTHQLALRLNHDGQGSPMWLSASYHTNEDPTLRALPLHRMFLPWVTLSDEPQLVVDNHDVIELKGGNWLRGEEIFFGEKAMCSMCHQMRGEGGWIGPDLSNLPQRDYASVLRDITHPSHAINPDFVTHVVETINGHVFTGTVRSAGTELIIGHQDGKETRALRDDVEAIRPSSVSVMPEKIPDTLGPEKLRDLLTFLLLEPPTMPNYGPLPPPAARHMDEVETILAGATRPTLTRPLRLVLVAGRKDHGPGEHDYPAWQKVWQRLLEMAEETHVSVADDWPTDDDLNSADVLVFYQQGRWTAERARDIDRFLARGGGLVYIHYAVDGGQDVLGFARRIGLAWKGGHSKFRHGALDVDFAPGADHPIARNFDEVHFHDESYWNLLGDPRQIHLLASGLEDGAAQPLFWTARCGSGRVFVSIPGHFAWTFDDPYFRTLLLRGIAWTAGEPVDRFNKLITPGARIRTTRTAR